MVLAAHHLQLDQRVALKVMLPHALVSGESVTRFLREARAAARISSEHVARVFDVGSLETGEPFMAMEYLEGTDIAELLAQRGRLSVEDATSYVLQACEALAEAHAVGIVHRDLKPANLFLVRRRDGRALVKVLDFGISKVVPGAHDSNSVATKTSALMGSPLYMSPEQMSSAKNVDARSDVWALGVVLYEMLAGVPPFNGETLPQVCAMVMGQAPTSLPELVPSLHPALVAVVDRCLEKNAAARYQSVAELARALDPHVTAEAHQSVERILRVQGAAPLVSTPPFKSASPGVAQAGTYAPLSRTEPPSKKRSVVPFVAGASMLLLVVAGLWLRREPQTSAAAPSASVSALVVAAAPTPLPLNTSVDLARTRPPAPSLDLARSASSRPTPSAPGRKRSELGGAATPPRSPPASPSQAVSPRASAAEPAAQAAPTAPLPVSSPLPTSTRSRL